MEPSPDPSKTDSVTPAPAASPTVPAYPAIPASQPTPAATPGMPVANFVPGNELSPMKKGLVWGIVSILVFVAGFFFGVAALLGAIFGSIGFRQGKKYSYKPAIVLGITGMVLNVGWFLLVVLLTQHA